MVFYIFAKQEKELRRRRNILYEFSEGILPEDELSWVRERYPNIVLGGCGVNNAKVSKPFVR